MSDSAPTPSPDSGTPLSDLARPGTNPSAPQYTVELPYPEELQAMLPAGAYIVEGFLGQGGMGAVYKGLQMPLKRPVAIKILAKGAGADYGFEERFKREAYAMAALTHPNIVRVYDCGDAGNDFLFISMELVEGGDLSDAIKAGQVTLEVALKLLPQICDGLQVAHERGIVHRDIKPANIFLTSDGRAKVADFGLAKNFDAGHTMVTKTGLGLGTPDYAAPEQFESSPDIDHRADIYSLGVMMYQLLTGSMPRGRWKPPSTKAGIDPRFDAVVVKALESDRADRYQSVAELKADILSITTQPAASATASGPVRPVSGPVRPATSAVRTGPVQTRTTGAIPMATRPTSGVPVRSQTSALSRPLPSAVPPVKKSRSSASLIAVVSAIIVLAAGAWVFLKPGGRSGRAVELLNGPAVKGDALRGVWLSTSTGLAAKPGNVGPGIKDEDRMPVFELPYIPPAEYDFEIEFTRYSGTIAQILTSGGAMFAHQFLYGNPDDGRPTRAGLTRLDEKSTDQLKDEGFAMVPPPPKDGQRHRALVEVRRGSVRSFLDGKEVMHWSGDSSRLSPSAMYRLNQESHLGFAVNNGEAMFHRATVWEISGPGQITSTSAPAIAAVENDRVSAADFKAFMDWVFECKGAFSARTGMAGRRVAKPEDLPASFDRVVEIDLPGNRPTKAMPPGMLQTVMSFKSMERLRLRRVMFTTKDYAPVLAAMPRLIEFCPQDDGIDEQIIGHLLPLSELENIGLGYCKNITGAGLDKLAALPKFNSLSVHYSALTDAGLANIGRVPGIRFLNVGATKITDAGLRALAGLKDLETFNITNTDISRRGLESLGVLSKLRRLDTWIGRGIPDMKELAALSPTLPNLQELSIDVSGPKEKENILQLAHLAELAAFPKLRRLELRGNGNIPASSLAGLDKLPLLDHLEVNYLFKDEDVLMLKQLKKLRLLRINADLTENGALKLLTINPLREVGRTAFTDPGLKLFKDNRPDVKILD